MILSHWLFREGKMLIIEKIEEILKNLGIFVLNGKYDIDSLKRVSLWYDLEKVFDIIIGDEDFWKAQDDNVSSLVELVEKYIEK